VLLFGSYGRDEQTEGSVIDIIIVSKDFENKNAFERPRIMYKQWKESYPVDFVCYTPKEFNKLKKGVTIVSEALREGVIIK